MQNIKVSIIIPIYNVEKYLCRCVDSVLSQTHENLEVILVDDGSPDRCPIICDEYAQKDSRVCVIHKQNGGSSSARNAGLQLVTGEYIMFVDSDDWIKRNTVEILVHNMIVNGNPDMCCFRMAKSDGVSYRTPIVGNYALKELRGSEDIIKDAMLGLNIKTSVCGKIYSSKFVKYNNLEFLNGVINEDSIFTLTAVAHATHVTFENSILYYIYSNEQSISRAIKERNFTSIFTVYDHVSNLYKEQLGIYNQWKDYLTANFIKMCAYTLVQAAYRIDIHLFLKYYNIIKNSMYSNSENSKSARKLLSSKIRMIYNLSQFPKMFYRLIKLFKLFGLRLQ